MQRKESQVFDQLSTVQLQLQQELDAVKRELSQVQQRRKEDQVPIDDAIISFNEISSITCVRR